MIQEIEDILNDKVLTAEDKEQEYFKSHKNYRKHWEFPADFPSTEVIGAYWKPPVDESTERPTWGDPDFESLVIFARDTLNWSESDIDMFLRVAEKKHKAKKEKKGKDTQGKLDTYFNKQE